MNDTDPKSAQKMKELLMAKSGEERLKMGFSTMAMVRSIVASAVQSAEPGLSAQKVRQRIFLRYYAKDFSSEECVKMIDKLKPCSCKHRLGSPLDEAHGKV